MNADIMAQSKCFRMTDDKMTYRCNLLLLQFRLFKQRTSQYKHWLKGKADLKMLFLFALSPNNGAL